MTFGLSDGTQYESQGDFHLGKPIQEGDQGRGVPGGTNKPTSELPKPAMGPSNNDGASTNWSNWLAGQSYLETSYTPAKNPTSSATGYFQFIKGTAERATKAGLPDPRAGGYEQQSAATQAYIQKFHPDAAQAIEAGDYKKATGLLKGEWPSLPGGSQMQGKERYNTWNQILSGQGPRPETGTRITVTPQHFDRTKDVPLAASAIINKEGSPTGVVAIDKDIPPHPEFDQFVHLHEMTEANHMKNLIDGGMKPADAYHEAHDRIATPVETAAVRAHAVRLGKDPDKYLEDYKQHWRNGAAVAAIGPFDRHEDAHTTRYGLDESELGKLKERVAMGGAKDSQVYRAMTDKEEMQAGGKRLMEEEVKKRNKESEPANKFYKDIRKEEEMHIFDQGDKEAII